MVLFLLLVLAAIALGILGAMGTVGSMDQHMLVGELSLDGTLRPVRGVLSMAACARRQGIPNLLVPADNASEAAVAEGVSVFGMRHLTEVVAFLANPTEFSPHLQNRAAAVAERAPQLDPPAEGEQDRPPIIEAARYHQPARIATMIAPRARLRSRNRLHRHCIAIQISAGPC